MIQFALARMDALEIAPRFRSPVFVFFPTYTQSLGYINASVGGYLRCAMRCCRFFSMRSEIEWHLAEVP
jgi:hypothetical protein